MVYADQTEHHKHKTKRTLSNHDGSSGSRLAASRFAPEGTRLRDAFELGTAQPPRKTDELRSNNKARRGICGVVAVRGINLR